MKANGVAEHRCLRYLAAIGELSWRSNRTYRRSMVTVSSALSNSNASTEVSAQAWAVREFTGLSALPTSVRYPHS